MSIFSNFQVSGGCLTGNFLFFTFHKVLIFCFTAVEFEFALFRLGYSLCILDELQKQFDGQKLVFMYDIACLLFKHLKVNIIYIVLINYFINQQTTNESRVVSVCLAFRYVLFGVLEVLVKNKKTE